MQNCCDFQCNFFYSAVQQSDVEGGSDSRAENDITEAMDFSEKSIRNGK